MTVSCHYRLCITLLLISVTRVISTIASVRAFIFRTYCSQIININESVCLSCADIKLLDHWYILDEQCMPSSYLLQPPSRYLSNLNAWSE